MLKASVDFKELFEKIKVNRETLNKCPRHAFLNIGDPPYRYNQRATCLVCGGEMLYAEISIYVQGFRAAGGNPDDVWPGYSS